VSFGPVVQKFERFERVPQASSSIRVSLSTFARSCTARHRVDQISDLFRYCSQRGRHCQGEQATCHALSRISSYYFTAKFAGEIILEIDQNLSKVTKI